MDLRAKKLPSVPPFLCVAARRAPFHAGKIRLLASHNLPKSPAVVLVPPELIKNPIFKKGKYRISISRGTWLYLLMRK
jgi:hypothetical protein